jgi:membrane-associated phospholipid phosphatase
MEKNGPLLLNRIWSTLRVYIWACILFWIVSLWIVVGIKPGSDLSWFNDWKGTWIDYVFIYGTKLGEEHSYILIMLILFFGRRKDVLWIPLIGIIVTIISFLGKQFFREPRPGAFATEPWFADRIILVDGIQPLTGLTSFPSGHTMSAFALACFIIYLFPLRRVWIFVVFGLAVLVGLSRVYLVMHFLRDVLTGSIIGVIVGLVLAYLHSKYSYSLAPSVSENKSSSD